MSQKLLIGFAQRQLARSVDQGIFAIIVGGHARRYAKDALKGEEGLQVRSFEARLELDGFKNEFGIAEWTSASWNFVSSVVACLRICPLRMLTRIRCSLPGYRTQTWTRWTPGNSLSCYVYAALLSWLTSIAFRRGILLEVFGFARCIERRSILPRRPADERVGRLHSFGRPEEAENQEVEETRKKVPMV